MKKLIIIVFALIFFSCGEKNSHYNAPVELSWSMLENMSSDDSLHYKTRLTIKNISSETLKNNWIIYYNQLPRVVKNLPNTPIKTEKIDASFFRMYPSEDYKEISAGDSLVFDVYFRGGAIKENEAPEGLYFVYTDENSQELSPLAIAPIKVAPFDKPSQWKRNKNDNYPYPTGQYLYEKDKDLVLSTELKTYDIIPSIKNTTLKSEQNIILPDNIKIEAPLELSNEITFLKNILINTNKAKISSSADFTINLSLDEKLKSKNDETYLLKTDKNQVSIIGASPKAVFWGIQTFRNMVGLSTFPVEFPIVSIEDYPDFEYRGFMLDIARNIQDKEAIKSVLEQMSRLKLNKFHFHFSDDEGWRLEIPSIPELTEFGARRGHTLDEKNHLYPVYGSGASPDNQKSGGNGYISKEDFVEILKYAKQRHIDVIPEIETPGHARASIKAMKYRYEKYKDKDLKKAEQYRLDDPADSSKYYSAQAYSDNVICVGRESAYNFFDAVVSDIVKMYAEAGIKLDVIHTGGDEVPRGSWEKSPICNKLVEEGKISNISEIRDYFTEKFKAVLDKHNTRFVGWMEIASKRKKPNEKFINSNFLAYCWDTVGEWGGEEAPYSLANAGYDVILCNAPNVYFDLSYNKHPKEPGLYWAGYVDERCSYDLLPFDIYRSVRLGLMGKKLDWNNDSKGKIALTQEGKQRIKGIQGELWSETIRSENMMQYYIFPKIFGLSERAWNAEPYWSKIPDDLKRESAYNKELGNYLTKISKKEMPMLNSEKINFRIAPPGIEIINGQLLITNSVPGAEVRYTTDGSEPNQNSVLWGESVRVDGNKIKAKTFYLGKNSLTSEYILL